MHIRIRFAMNQDSRKANPMLYTIALVLVILWVPGLVSSHTLGGLIHVLLVLALVAILVDVIGGRRGRRQLRRLASTTKSVCADPPCSSCTGGGSVSTLISGNGSLPGLTYTRATAAISDSALAFGSG